MLLLSLDEHEELFNSIVKTITLSTPEDWAGGYVYVKGMRWRFFRGERMEQQTFSESNISFTCDMLEEDIGKTVLNYVKEHYPEELL